MTASGTTRRRVLAAGGILALAPGGARAWEPSRPVRLVVTFAAGGPADLFGRILADAMARRLPQPVVVENRVGAGGMLGVEHVVRAAPDGHSLVLTGAGAIAIAPFRGQPMPFDPIADLAHLTMVARVPEVLVVAADGPHRDLAGLIAAGRARAHALTYGSAGVGSITHLASALFAMEARFEATHVPYGGAAPAVTDLLARRFDFMIADVPVLIGHIRAGRLRPLAVTTDARVASLPDVPTMAEAGLPRVNSDNWYGLAAPAATPADIRTRLHGAAMAALRDPVLVEAFARVDAIPAPMSPEETLAFLRAEQAKWGPVVRAAGA